MQGMNEERKKNTLFKSKLKQIWKQFDIIDRNFIKSSLKIAYNVDLFRCLKKFNWTACICSAWEFKCQKFNFVGNCFFPLLLLSIKVFDIITKSWNKRTVSIQFKSIWFSAHLSHWHLFVRASKLECRNNLLLSRQNSESIKNGGGGGPSLIFIRQGPTSPSPSFLALSF